MHKSSQKKSPSKQAVICQIKWSCQSLLAGRQRARSSVCCWLWLVLCALCVVNLDKHTTLSPFPHMPCPSAPLITAKGHARYWCSSKPCGHSRRMISSVALVKQSYLWGEKQLFGIGYCFGSLSFKVFLYDGCRMNCWFSAAVEHRGNTASTSSYVMIL